MHQLQNRLERRNQLHYCLLEYIEFQSFWEKMLEGAINKESCTVSQLGSWHNIGNDNSNVVHLAADVRNTDGRSLDGEGRPSAGV
jgi:hypothetical protein